MNSESVGKALDMIFRSEAIWFPFIVWVAGPIWSACFGFDGKQSVQRAKQTNALAEICHLGSDQLSPDDDWAVHTIFASKQCEHGRGQFSRDILAKARKHYPLEMSGSGTASVLRNPRLFPVFSDLRWITPVIHNK